MNQADHKPRPNIRRSTFWGVTLGIAYAMAMRLIFGLKGAEGILDTISTAFLFVMPSVMGAVCVIVARKEQGLHWGHYVLLPWISVFASMLSMMALMLEGSICIVMATPIFLVAASVGGVFAGFVSEKLARSRATLGAAFLLPLILAPIESGLDKRVELREVVTYIDVRAAASVVWSQITTVKNIDSSEVPFSITHFIGVPKPVSAEMSGEGMGERRTSKWGKGIYFGERVTTWLPNSELAYAFEVYPDSIPRDALDNHVEINGRYFDLVDGRYELRELGPGLTRLTLVTRYRNKSTMNWYGNLWGDFLFDDFHQSILGLIRYRSEQVTKH